MIPYTNSSNYLIVTGQHQLVSEPVYCSDYPDILKPTISLSLSGGEAHDIPGLNMKSTTRKIFIASRSRVPLVSCTAIVSISWPKHLMVKFVPINNFFSRAGGMTYGQDHNILKSPLKNERLLMFLSVLLL